MACTCKVLHGLTPPCLLSLDPKGKGRRKSPRTPQTCCVLEPPVLAHVVPSAQGVSRALLLFGARCAFVVGGCPVHGSSIPSWPLRAGGPEGQILSADHRALWIGSPIWC